MIVLGKNSLYNHLKETGCDLSVSRSELLTMQVRAAEPPSITSVSDGSVSIRSAPGQRTWSSVAEGGVRNDRR